MTDLGLFLLMCAAICLLIGAIKFLAWVSDAVERHRAGEPWIEVRPMSKVSAPPAPVVMSRAAPEPAPSAASSLETDSPPSPDRPMMPVPTEAQMLDVFKVLREAGVKREALRGAWKAAGLPLNNNVWADAAPDDDLTITPYAGRVTRRSYYAEPELEYQEPPA
jgi:hypothetical protein